MIAIAYHRLVVIVVWTQIPARYGVGKLGSDLEDRSLPAFTDRVGLIDAGFELSSWLIGVGDSLLEKLRQR